MKTLLSPQCPLIVLAAGIFLTLTALAMEPTTIEPAEPVDVGTIEVEQGVQYLDMDDDEWESETEISYGLNKYLRLGISLPFVFEEGEHGDLEDAGLFIEGVFNPDSASTLVGGELKLEFPTGDDSEGLAGEAQLRVTQPLGSGEKHALHLNLTGYYDTVDKEEHHCFCSEESTDREFRFGAALGYTYQATESTTLIAALSHEEDVDDTDDANLIEAGISHEFSPNVTAGLGVGTGLDSDSPDFEARAILHLSFSTGR